MKRENLFQLNAYYEGTENEKVRTDKMTWGPRAYRPPSPLSTIVSGIEGTMGTNSTITVFRAPELVDSRLSTKPILAVFGILDLLFIVKIVLSFAAILFSYDVISGEKETGTLRLVASNPVSRDTIIIGKCIGGYLSLVIPLLIPVLIGTLMMILLFDVHFMPEDCVRFIGILGVFFLYIFVVFS